MKILISHDKIFNDNNWKDTYCSIRRFEFHNNRFDIIINSMYTIVYERNILRIILK